jgi:hypothetical protein
MVRERRKEAAPVLGPGGFAVRIILRSHADKAAAVELARE